MLLTTNPKVHPDRSMSFGDDPSVSLRNVNISFHKGASYFPAKLGPISTGRPIYKRKPSDQTAIGESRSPLRV